MKLAVDSIIDKYNLDLMLNPDLFKLYSLSKDITDLNPKEQKSVNTVVTKQVLKWISENINQLYKIKKNYAKYISFHQILKQKGIDLGVKESKLYPGRLIMYGFYSEYEFDKNCFVGVLLETKSEKEVHSYFILICKEEEIFTAKPFKKTITVIESGKSKFDEITDENELITDLEQLLNSL